MIQRGIDHLVLCVKDLDAARQRYERLGFTLTPPARHPFGTGNSLVQLQGSFLELLYIAAPEQIPPHAPGQFSFAAFSQDYLRGGEGLSMLVFESQDARHDQAGFIRAGLQTYAPFDFSRQATLPDGRQVTVGFSLAFVTHPDLKRAAFFTCQQHAPEYFWKPEYQRHRNTAQAVKEVCMLAAEPLALRDLFSGLQQPDVVTETNGNLQITTARGSVVILTPDAFQDRWPEQTPPSMEHGAVFAGFSLTVADLSAARECVQNSGLRFVETADALQIPASELFGVALELRRDCS